MISLCVSTVWKDKIFVYTEVIAYNYQLTVRDLVGLAYFKDYCNALKTLFSNFLMLFSGLMFICRLPGATSKRHKSCV